MEKKKEIKVFDYEGTPISFEFAEGLKMINATQMAKSYNDNIVPKEPKRKKKLPAEFLRLNQTKEFIAAYEKRYEKSHNEIVRVVRGGNAKTQGTWMSEKLALKFAAWLYPDFELWIYDKIYELFTEGVTQLPYNKQTVEWYLQKVYDNVKENQILLEDIPLKGIDVTKLNPMFPAKTKKKK